MTKLARTSMALVAVVLGGCKALVGEPTPSPAAAVTLTRSHALLAVGESYQLGVIARDGSGQPLPDVAFTWASSNESIATVSDGRATAHGAGTVQITASVGGVTSGTAEVVVVAADASTPTSAALIATALAAGTIDAEHALVYRVFAAFHDPRLPVQYKGNDRSAHDAGVVAELQARMPTLPTETQKLLAPFLMRPAAPGSWANPLAEVAARLPTPVVPPPCENADPQHAALWATDSIASDHVVVWYDAAMVGHRGLATEVATALETKIWPKLIDEVHFKEPLPDAPTSESACFGLDTRLDVYIVADMPVEYDEAAGLFQPAFSAAQTSPGFVLIQSLADLEAVTAHEFMHSIQYSYTTRSLQARYGWLNEATAEWATDSVYKDDQFEHRFAPCVFDEPERSLDDTVCGGDPELRAYGMYLFFQFLDHDGGGPEAVKRVVMQRSSDGDPLVAVDNGITGGLVQQWPRFATKMWNQEPITTTVGSFAQWDDLNLVPKTASSSGDLDGAAGAEIDDFPLELKYASSSYVHITFSDPMSRSLLFHNGFFSAIQGGKKITIQALWKDEDGIWNEEDWGKYEFVGTCRDIRKQRMQELVVVFANAEIDGATVVSTDPTYLSVNNIGCWKYAGTFTTVDDGGSSVTWRNAVDSTDTFTLGIPVSGEGLQAALPQLPNTLRVGLTSLFAMEGSYHFGYHSQSGTCSEYIDPPIQVPLQNPAGGIAMLNTFNDPLLTSSDPWLASVLAQPRGRYFIQLGDARLFPTQGGGGVCGAPSPAAPGMLVMTPPGSDTDPFASSPIVDGDGNMIGTFSDAGITSSWNLTPQRQP